MQLGGGSQQFARPLGHLQLELVAGSAQLVLGAAALVDETGALECRRGVIGRHREQELVRLGGKVGAIRGDRDQTAVGIDTDGHDQTTAALPIAADVGDDRLARTGADPREVTVQPFRKGFPPVASRDVDRSTAVGIAQAHERELQVQGPDEHVGQPGRDGRRLSAHPRRRDRRQRHQIPERGAQPVNLAGVHGSQLALRAYLRTDRRSRISRRNWSGGTKNGFSCSTPPMITAGWVRRMSTVTLDPNFVRS